MFLCFWLIGYYVLVFKIHINDGQIHGMEHGSHFPGFQNENFSFATADHQPILGQPAAAGVADYIEFVVAELSPGVVGAA